MIAHAPAVGPVLSEQQRSMTTAATIGPTKSSAAMAPRAAET